jgi:hypothetical protein
VALLACPFCRELFARDERTTCPVCGVALVAADKLPPSYDARAEEPEAEPEYEPLPPTYLSRGRGALAGLAVAGLVAFLAPWIDETMPDIVTYSGLDVARKLVWAWAAGVAWFILLPTVLSRRSIVQMRGARVAAGFLSAIPGLSAGILLARPPHGSHGVPLRFTFAAGLYATLALSLAALAAALRFGGRVDDIRVRRGSSAGEVVH